MLDDASPAIKNLLVTGGAGFIGTNFCYWVTRNVPGVRLIVLDALTYAGNAENLRGLPSDRFEFVQGDICDRALVRELFSEVDACIHFAAESHNDNSIADPDPFLRANVAGTYALLEAAREFDVRFHHASTDEVFGDLPLDGAGRFTSESPYRPSSPYSATKAAADLLVRAWVRTYGLRATITCCSNNYGPFQHPEKFIPRQITFLLEGKKPQLYGDGLHVRDWIHVEDHARAVWEVLERGRVGDTYLVSAGNELSNHEVLSAVLSEMGYPEDFYERTPDRPGHDRRYALDASRIESELGWKPVHVDFRKGLRETIEWYKRNMSWWQELV